MNKTDKIVQKITEAIQEKKGKRIVIADLTTIEDTICNYFVICEGNSPSQVTAIVDSIKDYVRKETGEKVYAIDGLCAMHSGWLWIMETYWYTCSCQKNATSIIWSTYGPMQN